jgi:hypothetical protein
MNMKRQFTFTLALCALGAFRGLAAQPVADAAHEVMQLMEDARHNKVPPLRDSVLSAPPAQVLAELRKYMHDPDKRVRYRIPFIASSVGHEHGQVRRQTIDFLLELATANPSDLVAEASIETLTSFSTGDFTTPQRQQIQELLSGSPTEKLLLLAGVAEVRAAAPQLRQWADKGRWPAQLSLARMGDPNAVTAVISTVEGTTDERRRLAMLDDLAFIRQPEAVAVLLEYLFSDKRTIALPPDVGSVGYAYRALSPLGTAVEGFPVYDVKGSIERVRQWVLEQGGAAKLKIKR